MVTVWNPLTTQRTTQLFEEEVCVVRKLSAKRVLICFASKLQMWDASMGHMINEIRITDDTCRSLQRSKCVEYKGVLYYRCHKTGELMTFDLVTGDVGCYEDVDIISDNPQHSPVEEVLYGFGRHLVVRCDAKYEAWDVVSRKKTCLFDVGDTRFEAGKEHLLAFSCSDCVFVYSLLTRSKLQSFHDPYISHIVVTNSGKLVLFDGVNKRCDQHASPCPHAFPKALNESMFVAVSDKNKMVLFS